MNICFTRSQLYRTETNSLLERRLQMIEERLHVLDSDGRFAEADKSTSSATHDDHHARTSVGIDSPLDRNDGVDGMGAIPLSNGAAEEEYFGMGPQRSVPHPPIP